MDLEKVKQLKVALLKEAIKGKKAGEKSSIYSIIYPATDHGPNEPHTLKTHATVPSTNDENGEESIGEPDDEGVPEEDGPGTSKTTSSSLRVVPGESAMVSPQHKHTQLARFSIVKEDKHKTSPFVQRCVAAITGGKPENRDDLSGSFAKCVSTEQKSQKDLSKNALRREGYPAAKERFVKAISTFKKKQDGY
jgi:hypothetical protein